MVGGAAGMVAWAASGLSNRNSAPGVLKEKAVMTEPAYCFIELMVLQNTQERFAMVSQTDLLSMPFRRRYKPVHSRRQNPLYKSVMLTYSDRVP